MEQGHEEGRGDPAKAFPVLSPQSPNEPKPQFWRRNRRTTCSTAEASATYERPTSIHASILSFTNMHQYGDLLVRYLKARHETFIVGKGWRLPESEGMEFDQYDTPYARWVILHEFGQVLGGVRLLPTSSNCGLHSYMIRDAQLGLLPEIPQNLLYIPAPVSERIWEASRLFISPHVLGKRRREIQSILMREMTSAAFSLGANYIIGIVPSVHSRWMARLGLANAVPVGRLLKFDGERAQAAILGLKSFTCTRSVTGSSPNLLTTRVAA